MLNVTSLTIKIKNQNRYLKKMRLVTFKKVIKIVRIKNDLFSDFI